MPADTDYVIFFVAALLAVVGAGLLRVGLMKSRGRLFIALGIAFGIAAVLILVLRTRTISQKHISRLKKVLLPRAL
jgi:hypothetical protein